MKLHKSVQILAACGLILSLAGGTQGGPPANIAPASAGTGRITAVISGLLGHDGCLRVSLFSVSSFPDGVPLARRDIALPALGPQALHPLKVTFDGLRPGVYAVCAFHDRDGSGKLTQDFLGIPTEEWGMSGNPRPQFRAPRFDEAKTDLSRQEDKRLLITLHT